MDLVRPLGEAGYRCAVASDGGDPTRWSRHTRAVIPSDEPRLLERLLEFGRERGDRPALFYQADWSLRLVSEHREALSQAFRFVIPDRRTVERLLSKEEFRVLGEELGLGVPRSLLSAPALGDPPPAGAPFPLIVKPAGGRDDAWDAQFGRSLKAVRVDDQDALAAIWERLARRGGQVLLQELIPGPESLIESYHAYVDADGRIAAEFTGRKIRTHPVEYGASCSLETTDAADVRAAGREFVERSGFRGVLKADYKRRADGSLALLEVNPRFSLWHSLGAAAGVNIPAVVMADLTGGERPAPARARPGLVWCDLPADMRSARALGMSRAAWLRFALTSCDVRSAWSWRDPMPFVRGKLLRRLRRRR